MKMLIQILFNIIFNRVSDVNFFSRGKEKKVVVYPTKLSFGCKKQQHIRIK